MGRKDLFQQSVSPQIWRSLWLKMCCGVMRIIKVVSCFWKMSCRGFRSVTRTSWLSCSASVRHWLWFYSSSRWLHYCLQSSLSSHWEVCFSSTSASSPMMGIVLVDFMRNRNLSVISLLLDYCSEHATNGSTISLYSAFCPSVMHLRAAEPLEYICRWDY